MARAHSTNLAHSPTGAASTSAVTSTARGATTGAAVVSTTIGGAAGRGPSPAAHAPMSRSNAVAAKNSRKVRCGKLNARASSTRPVSGISKPDRVTTSAMNRSGSCHCL
jgi:hypothetical protein